MTTTTITKHPRGGRLVVTLHGNQISATITDTRKLNGKRRSVVANVFQRGCLGWEVAINPGNDGPDFVRAYPQVSTPDAAYELAISDCGK